MGRIRDARVVVPTGDEGRSVMRNCFQLQPDGKWRVEIDLSARSVLLRCFARPEWEDCLSSARRRLDLSEQERLITSALQDVIRGVYPGEDVGVVLELPGGIVLMLARALSYLAVADGVDEKTGTGLSEWSASLCENVGEEKGWQEFWNRLLSTDTSLLVAGVSDDHATRMTKSATTYRRLGEKVGRNEPCPCGSERKHKKCCG